MNRDAEEVLGRVMVSFDGGTLPAPVAERLATRPAAGVSLFRAFNDGTPDQVRTLSDAIQAAGARFGANAGDRAGRPLLVAADQEGGQLIALSAGTAFPGNMALGAAGDPDLAERVGQATGIELRAMGVNVCYAPVCDIATEPAHPALGIRSFGDDPGRVADLVAATVRGLQSAGVAAALKHFPGKGDVAIDTHHALAVVTHDRARFDAVELRPFRAGIAAGARLVMSGHFAVPGLTGRDDLTATQSPDVMVRLLRDELGFTGSSISDALDMKALDQGLGHADAVLAAVRAGVDLLLFHDPGQREAVERALIGAAESGVLGRSEIERSASRIGELRRWLGGFTAPDPAVVGSAVHAALAREVAERSVTLIRDDAGLLPLRLPADARIAAIMPTPEDLTPADTSSTVAPGLAAALRRHHGAVDEFVVSQRPHEDEIARVVLAASDADLVVVGTIAASLQPAQAVLVRSLIGTGRPVVTVALRTPFDLAAYPEAATHACAYSILPVSMAALVAALFGDIPFQGRLPAAIPGLYRAGHRRAA